MLRRSLSLLLMLSLLLGGGPACCVPGVAVAADAEAMAAAPAPTQAKAGCHDVAETPDDSAPSSPADLDEASGDCQRCSHCLTSAQLAAPVQVTIFAAPAADSAWVLPFAGLPPFSPALRPPISLAALHAT